MVTKRTYTPEQIEQFQVNRKRQLDELAETLEKQVDKVVADPAQWRAFLKLAGQFRQYSPRNQVMIMAQNPMAEIVAPYGVWKAKGRQVMKGEKGIRILRPNMVRCSEDEEGATPSINAKGERIWRKLVGFKQESVFEISQTSGPENEVLSPRMAKGVAPEWLWDELVGFLNTKGFNVTVGATGGAQLYGWTQYSTQEIRVSVHLDEVSRLRTLIHETGHALLHQPGDDGRPECRGTVEVEAESVAYSVGQLLGLEIGETSFQYIAGWADNAIKNTGQTRTDLVLETAKRVRGAVNEILDGIDWENQAKTELIQITEQVREEIEDTQAHREAATNLEREQKREHLNQKIAEVKRSINEAQSRQQTTHESALMQMGEEEFDDYIQRAEADPLDVAGFPGDYPVIIAQTRHTELDGSEVEGTNHTIATPSRHGNGRTGGLSTVPD